MGYRYFDDQRLWDLTVEVFTRNGYSRSDCEDIANVLLASAEKDDPILSVMQYGLGHTVAWNTDVTNRWTAGLAQQNDYVQLWKRIIDYSAGNTALGEDRVDVTTVNGTTKVTYLSLIHI